LSNVRLGGRRQLSLVEHWIRRYIHQVRLDSGRASWAIGLK
jgi:hypothetical protein